MMAFRCNANFLSSVGVLCLGISTAQAATIQLELPGTLDRQSVSYSCRSGQSLSVDYYNLPESSLAVLSVAGAPRVFVAVLAASGAKYVSGPHVWWTRGNRGDLIDETKPDADPDLCKVTR
ncbi:MAG: MliC family protein [Rhizobiaceae bacterium]|nr:MliC family protein [Rhizobiaceae bacterium]